jgi:glycosyltransferase involved in cell wall biosynthesis
MSGPQNFLSRLDKALLIYDLPKYQIINPNNKGLVLLNNKELLNIGRLDGVKYYKATSTNLYNYIRQKKNLNMSVLNYIPDFLVEKLTFPLNSYLNRINKNIIKNSHGIVFQSELSKNMHARFIGETADSSVIILNGIPTEVFNPNIGKSSLEGYPRLVITASFRLHKRLQDAVNAVNMLRKKFPKIKLHIIGDFDLLTKELMFKLDLSSCVLHGRVDSESLPSIYNSCDLGLSLCIFDSCPNSVVEMMGCGLPVISNSHSGAVELLKCKDLIVKDDFEIDYIELQTAEKIPEINTEILVNAVEKVLDSREYYSDIVLERVEEELDIRLVAEKYANYIMETYDAIS